MPNPTADIETKRPHLKIDFVSDVACPWCAVGLASLEKAIDSLKEVVDVTIHFQPFELNPNMSAEGENASQYLKAKYGMSDAQLQANRTRLVQAGAAVDFEFAMNRAWVWNTFAAHRLLYWAALPESGGSPAHQQAMKKALLSAYHSRNENPAGASTLLAAAINSGFEAEAAKEVIESDRYSLEVRKAQRQWQSAGISSVPAIIFEQQHLLSGAQPTEVFEAAIKQLATAK
jgi:predicted DsbA family dithiol-disulfide isomerase